MTEFNAPSIITSAQSPYETKASDARMHRKNRDKVHYNKSRKEGFQNTTVDTNTSTRISVNALILYIENYIAENEDGFTLNVYQDIKKESYLAPWMHKSHSNNNHKHVQNTQAVNAYKHAAAAANQNINQLQSQAPRNKQSVNEDDLRALIKDLQYLNKKGVHALDITVSSAFIQAIFMAVQTEKSALERISTF